VISAITTIVYCNDRQCKYRSDFDMKRLLSDSLHELGYDGRISLIETGCLISCHQGPSIMFLPGGKVYQVSTEKQFTEVLRDLLRNKDWSFCETEDISMRKASRNILLMKDMKRFARY